MKYISEKEQWNRLLKIKIKKQGNNQWRLAPVSDKNGTQVRKGDITFRGTEEKFKLLLRRLKASDIETTPASVKNLTYQQMIDLADTPKGNYIWVKTKNWNMYYNGKELLLGESVDKDIDIFIQRNRDRMDSDTLAGLVADKFNMDLVDVYDLLKTVYNIKVIKENNMKEIKEASSDPMIVVFYDSKGRVGKMETSKFMSTYAHRNEFLSDAVERFNREKQMDGGDTVAKIEFNETTKRSNDMRKVEEAKGVDMRDKSGIKEGSRRVTKDMIDMYLETALWASIDLDTDEPMDDRYSIYDFDKNSRREAERDLQAFLNKASPYLDDVDDEGIGNNFWLSRNGHGAGFFDSDYEYADKLQDIARSFGEKYLFGKEDTVFYESKYKGDKNLSLIEISKSVKVGNVILEKGDKIKVLENTSWNIDKILKPLNNMKSISL